jgi:O-antigen ligase
MAVEAARVGPRAERAWGAALLVGAGVAGASVLSLATAGLSMALAVAGVGLALFLGVVLADYRVGVLALPFAILLSPDLGGGSLVHLRITDLLLPVVLAGWMLRRVAVGEPLVRTPVNGLVMVLLVAGLVSTSLGVLRGTIHPLSLGAVFLLSRVEYLLIFFLAVQAARSLPWGRRLAGALLWGFAVTAAVGLYQHAAFGPQYIVSGVRANERATFAAVLVFLLMMAAGMAVTLRAWWQRLALCALALAAAVPLLYTYSRGAYVALAAGLLFLGLRRSRGVLLVLAVLVVFSSVLLPLEIRSRISSIAVVVGAPEQTYQSWSARLGAWSVVGHQILSHPLLGYGMGALPLGWIDNEFLKEAYYGGILGLALYAAVLWGIWRTASRVAHRAPQLWARAVAWGFLAGYVALLVQSLSGTTLTAIRSAEIFWFAAGLVAGLGSREGPDTSPEERV